MAFDRITIVHEKMGGLPCIRDLRIPVSTILGQLATGRETGKILEDFPVWSPRTSWLPWNTPQQRFRSVSCHWQLGDEVPSRRHVSHRVAQLLRDAGIEARLKFVITICSTPPIPRSWSSRGGTVFVLVSEDTDFGELLARQCTVAPSFVLLRTYEPMTPDEQAAVLLANLPGCTTTSTKGPSWSSSGVGFEYGAFRCCPRYPNSGSSNRRHVTNSRCQPAYSGTASGKTASSSARSWTSA